MKTTRQFLAASALALALGACGGGGENSVDPSPSSSTTAVPEDCAYLVCQEDPGNARVTVCKEGGGNTESCIGDVSNTSSADCKKCTWKSGQYDVDCNTLQGTLTQPCPDSSGQPGTERDCTDGNVCADRSTDCKKTCSGVSGSGNWIDGCDCDKYIVFSGSNLDLIDGAENDNEDIGDDASSDDDFGDDEGE